MKAIKLKSLEEVVERFKELVHRHRRRFLKRFLRPCPNNCKKAELVGRKVVGCPGCGSRNPEFCKKPEKFEPLYTKEELAKQFHDAVHDRETLLKEYRDLVVFLWLFGEFDDPKVAPETLKVETHDTGRTPAS